MSIGRFTELALAHGATRTRWPQHERALYDHFAATPDGMAILADAERVDLFLDAWQPQADDAARVERIMDAARASGAAPGTETMPVPVFASSRPRYAAWLSTGFLASALLGFVLGFAQIDTVDDGPAYTELLLGNPSALEESL